MIKTQAEVCRRLGDNILSSSTDKPFLVVINGKDGSGKTTLSRALCEHLASRTVRQIISITIDNFMNPRSVRYSPRETEAIECYENTYNFDAFMCDVLQPLTDGRRIYKPRVFDYDTDRPMIAADNIASIDAVVIVEGIYLLKQEFLPYWGLKILLETDDAAVIKRGAVRDQYKHGGLAASTQKYIKRYIAAQRLYYKEHKPAEHADIIIDNNDTAAPFFVRLPV